MKTLANYKKQYKTAKTTKTKISVFNKAMLNLTYEEQQKFIMWQTTLNA